MNHQNFRGACAAALAAFLATTGFMAQVGNAETAIPTPTSSAKPVVPAASNTLIDLTSRSKQYKTLVAAIKAADLTETLASQGPFTLFAPNDVAFQKLPKGTLAKLLKPENKAALQQILKYHVLSGLVTSKDLKNGQVETVEGGKVTFKVSSKGATINNAKIIKANVRVSNGVAHAIDQVLIPANLQLK